MIYTSLQIELNKFHFK